MNDVTVTASCDSRDVGETKMTVLWVEIKLKTAGTVSREHEKYGSIIKDAHKGKLGEIAYAYEQGGKKKYKMGFGFEIAGQVYPKDFKDKVDLFRDSEGVMIDLLNNNNWSVSSRFQSKIPGELPVNDKSLPQHLDESPDKIFDYDVPGLTPTLDTNTAAVQYDKDVVTNFREFASCNNVRCSDVLSFHVYISLKYTIKNGVLTVDSNSSAATLKNGHVGMPSGF